MVLFTGNGRLTGGAILVGLFWSSMGLDSLTFLPLIRNFTVDRNYSVDFTFPFVIFS